MTELEPVQIPAVKLVDHLFSLAKLLQGAQSEDIIHFNTAETKGQLSEFIRDPLPATIFCFKLQDSWLISSSLEEVKEPLSTIVLVKDNGTLTDSSCLDTQLQVVNLPNIGSSFETLRSLVSLGVGSYFDAITNDNKTDFVSSTRKKINELALSLRNLEQSIHTPDLSITLHPILKEAIKNGANLENYIEIIPETTLLDPAFLNSLQNIVNNWVKEIQEITKLQRDVPHDSAFDEINYWTSMEVSLTSIQNQVGSVGVQLTLEVLKYAKRYHATVSFLSDIGIQDVIAQTADYNKLMKDLPLNELLAAESIGKMEEAIVLVMNHLKRIRLTSYPISRALPFVEAISSDLDTKIKPTLKHSMALDYSLFQTEIDSVISLLDNWDKQIKEFTNIARELLRKRGEKFIFVKINSRTNDLRDRLNEISLFRKSHQDFLNTLQDSPILQNDLTFAYEAVKDIDVFESEKAWNSSRSLYDTRVQQIENDIVNNLKTSLADASNSNELFEIFENYNNLLERPRIRKAIQEYQSHLLDIVKEEINHLQQNFASKIGIKQISELRDYSDFSYLLLWGKQIQDKLEFLMQRLELIFGKDWNSYSEGQRIYEECQVFKAKLDMTDRFEDWTNQAKDYTVSGNVIQLVKDKDVSLQLNFDDSLTNFFKEVRALSWQGFQIPHQIILNSRKVRKIYMHAVVLQESLSTLSQLNQTFESLDDLGVLLCDMKSELFDSIARALEINWEDLLKAYDLQNIEVKVEEQEKLAVIVKIEDLIADFSKKLNDLIVYRDQIKELFDELTHPEFSSEQLSFTISKLQSVVNEISKSSYSQIDLFIEKLNIRLARRLVVIFNNLKFDADTIKHEIIVGDNLTASPPFEHTKTLLYSKIQSSLLAIFSQRKLVQSSLDSIDENTLVDLEPHISVLLEKFKTSINQIETDFINSVTFIEKWQQSQYLWDSNSDEIYADLTLESWLELFNEVKKSKSVFDIAQAISKFGVFSIDFQNAKEVIYSKFLSWNRDLLRNFSVFLSETLKTLHYTLTKGIQLLDSSDVSLTSVNQTVEFISNVEDQKVLLKELESKLLLLKQGELILFRNKAKLDPDHIYVDQIENDYTSLKDLILLRSSSIDKHQDIISKNIDIEAQRVENLIKEVRDSWSEAKINIEPEEANSIISSFESKISSIEKRKDLLNTAAHLLVLPVSVSGDLSSTLEELADIKSFWISMQGLWDSLDDLKKAEWTSLKPRQLRKQLDDLLQNTRSMPVRVRQHQAYQKFLKIIMDISSSQKVVLLLREEFFKERHLKLLFTKLGESFTSRLTIGDIWGLNLQLHEHVVNQIVAQAESERVIEDSLTLINENWSNQEFDFFNFHNQRLVNNFQHLLELCSTDLASLASMKNSSTFKTFETEINQWTSKLQTLYNIFDNWVEVQRQWMDLDGVFDPKSGINKLLGAESARFQGISVEFISTTKRIFKSSVVIDSISISDLGQIMHRLSESLNKISKALGDFLEKQRELYPRFYFVGNDDLLAMLGNDDVNQISKHFKKMFPGIASVVFDDKARIITNVSSENGELITLLDPIELTKYERIDEWISQLDYQVKITLANLLKDCIDSFDIVKIADLFGQFPEQIVLLSLQIIWTKETENSIESGNFDTQISKIDQQLDYLTITNTNHEKKFESLIIETFHQRDVVIELKENQVNSKLNYYWNSVQRFYHNHLASDPLYSVKIKQLTTEFTYGFEYLGAMERLVYTPLLNQCFMAMTGALEQGLGGSPFGPAGTGKTESIKAMGNLLGKMVVVFNCDESFDFQAVGRLLSGICQIGGWGCFDEFNRLNKNILSAVSSQLVQIEFGLKYKSKNIELLDKRIPLIEGTGVFVTMNPGYSGRSELPENLKKLFRSFSMVKADSVLICKVLLAAGGFTEADCISHKVVEFFEELNSRVSTQKYYDFGLRSLKSTLENAVIILNKDSSYGSNQLGVIVKSLREMLLPRLTINDSVIFGNSVDQFFPNIKEVDSSQEIREKIKAIAEKNGLNPTNSWITKSLQLAKIQETQQGVIVAGTSGSGKSSIISTVIEALGQTEINIEPKVLKKYELFGQFYPSTRQWNDGLFTSIIRKINEDLRGDLNKKFCIVFDGDIDPVWIESLNSVLDDNKTLTLPNGERLRIPPNIRFVFETHSLENATPATISRCGMIIMESNILSTDDIFQQKLVYLQKTFSVKNYEFSEAQDIILNYASHLMEFLGHGLLEECLSISLQDIEHISNVTTVSLINSLFIFLQSYLDKFLNEGGSLDALYDYSKNSLNLALFYGLVGSANTSERLKFCKSLKRLVPDYPDSLDYYVNVEGQIKRYYPLSISLDPYSIVNPNTVIETTDTLRHEDVIHSVLSQNASLILCGPPGAGKTMSLYAVLQKSPEIDLINLNFSKETDPTIVLRAIEQCCDYIRTNDGFILRPKTVGKRVVVFTDEINLPKPDEFGTQTVIAFLRQLVEKRGFWKVAEKQWVSIQDIQFVGACNPSTDAGRYQLSERFLSHTPVIMVDYPGLSSLFQIYDSFINALLKIIPHLKGFSRELTESMLEIYTKISDIFTTENQPHYIYTPRELTRWVRGLYSALSTNMEESLEMDDLIRLFIHEAIRLFSDRLVTASEKESSFAIIKDVINNHFPNLNQAVVLKCPILYSNWLSLNYSEVSLESISQFIKDKFDVFTQEMLDVDFVFYDSLIQEILNIDRVLKQSGGHLMLIGPSGSGKRTLTKFVAWMNGLKVNQLNINRNYSIYQFDQTLKEILKACGVEGEKLVFLLDTSNIKQPAFFERINSLLANGQINDLFDPDEYSLLLRSVRDQSQMNNVLVDSDDEVENILISNISQNLHVVFTMTGIDTQDGPQIISSPALFNRCVIDWIGEMSEKTMTQIAVKKLQMSPIGAIESVVKSLIFIHNSNPEQQPPAKFFQLIDNFIYLFNQRQKLLDESQRRTNNGVIKLKETVLTVSHQRKELTQKQESLKKKELEAHEMLNRILEDQNLSERKKEASIAIKKTLSKQDIIIEKRREQVLRDLELAEPAVLEARAGVQNIKKQHLTELRSMSSPPATIQLILESVCILLCYEVNSWRDVQSIIRKDDFIYNIVHFDCEQQVTPEVREYMEVNYLSKPEYNQQAAFRASQACGPLLQWVEAQVRYSIVLGKVGPLQDEIEQLELESQQTRARLAAADDMIEELDESITNYKNGYTQMIRETENIRSEIKVVENRTERSMNIVQNLEDEKNRWIETIKSFKDQVQNLIPESLLSASVFTYSGVMDYKFRTEQYKIWSNFLKSNGFEFTYTKVTDILNTTTNLVQWERCGLPNDELFFENVTILERIEFPKVRYVIDGVGNLLQTLCNKLEGKVSLTSFLNKSFIHDLQNALRFGGNLIVQDAEYFDPILAPLLSGDYQKIGGRTLIKIGDKDVDCSPDFNLVLYTKDHTVKIPKFVYATTTVIDFNVTETSLEIKSLDMIVKSEKPEVYQKKLDYVKLSNNYKFELNSLENILLESLNMEGNLLDNLDLLQNLEDIKQKATDVNQKIKETMGVMNEIAEISAVFQPFAKSSSGLFSLLNKLGNLHLFYQFSLNDYILWIQQVLNKSEKKGTSSRVFYLLEELYKEVFNNISLSLTERDRKSILIAFNMLLVTERDNESYSTCILKLLESGIYDADEKVEILKDAFAKLSVHIPKEVLTSSLKSSNPEGIISQLKEKNIDTNPFELILNGVLRQDSRESFSSIFEYLLKSLKTHKPLDLNSVIENNNGKSIILTSASSLDPTYKVLELCQKEAMDLKIVSLGSLESIKMANREISKASRQGGWVLIQNAHISPDWLESFEKTFSSYQSNKTFRLFLTCDSRAEIPISIIRNSTVLMFESNPGIKSIFQENFKPSAEIIPVEKQYIYYLITWFHSILQERTKYVPKGFTKAYDFNDSDFQSAFYFIDKLFDTLHTGKSHVSPEVLDWKLISSVIGGIIYGGKVDVLSDLEYLKDLSDYIFTGKSFEIDFNLIKDHGVILRPPEGRLVNDYEKWIADLPILEPISWLGLDEDSEFLVKRKEFKEILENAKKLIAYK